MNRDALLSTSLGGGGARQPVFVQPRPASDPGDENSDLGSDAGWHFTVGSDSDEGAVASRDDVPDVELQLRPGDVDAGADGLPGEGDVEAEREQRPGRGEQQWVDGGRSYAQVEGPSAAMAGLCIATGQGLSNAQTTADLRDSGGPFSSAIDPAAPRASAPSMAAMSDGEGRSASHGPPVIASAHAASSQLQDGAYMAFPQYPASHGASDSPGAFPVRQTTGHASVSTAEVAAAAAAAADEDDEVGMINIIRGYRGVTRSTANPGASGLARPPAAPVEYPGSVSTNTPPSSGRLYGAPGSEDLGLRPRSSSNQSPMLYPHNIAPSLPCPAAGSGGHHLSPPAVPQHPYSAHRHSAAAAGAEEKERMLYGGASKPVDGWVPSDEDHTQRGLLEKFSSGKGASPQSWGRPSERHPARGASVTSSESSAIAGGPFLGSSARRESAPGVIDGGSPGVGPVVAAFDARGSPNPDTGATLHSTAGVASLSSGHMPASGYVRPSPAASSPVVGLADRSSAQVARTLPVPLSASAELTILECVVEMLKGSDCLKRRNMFRVTAASIWLDPDMSAIRYRTMPKNGPVQEEEIVVSKVRRIKIADREITIWVDEKKSVDFILPTRERACVWLSGLCCLVPARASIKSHSKHRHVTEHRANYDPLYDSWNGKPLTERKWFKQYILLGSIGRGAFGKVKIALSRSDLHFYAVKVLSKAMMRKQNRNSAFDRVSQHDTSSVGQGAEGEAAIDVNEVAVMRRLDHPNVVKLYDTYDDVVNDRLFIVLEYVPNGPVMNSSKLQGAATLEKSQVKSIFVDAVAGLMYLHSQSVVHRDFKPENLLLGGDQRAKISDFGSAKAFDEDASHRGEEATPSAQRTTVGTPAFTAPELCLSERSPRVTGVPYAADIWSLGATLFYMLYGRAPFLAKSVFEMYDAICSNQLSFPDACTPESSHQILLRSLLEKSPERRASFRTILSSQYLVEGSDVQLHGRIEALRSLL